jgi:RNA polymerase sigma-70 factor (ECF subfamily)
MDMGPSSTAETALGAPLVESAWVMPIADASVLPEDGDPAEVASQRETLRLAFVAALQHLPPRQRAVLILREVLRFQASEVAELLDTSVASVNSALQRARATLDAADLDAGGPVAVDDDEQRELLGRYVEAFERYDIEALVALLHDDAKFTMPPHPMWLVGPLEVSRWLLGQGCGCRGSRVLTATANGGAAFATYRPDPAGGHTPFAFVLMETGGGRISGLHHFLFPELFPAFGLPEHLD